MAKIGAKLKNSQTRKCLTSIPGHATLPTNTQIASMETSRRPNPVQRAWAGGSQVQRTALKIPPELRPELQVYDHP